MNLILVFVRLLFLEFHTEPLGYHIYNPFAGPGVVAKIARHTSYGSFPRTSFSTPFGNRGREKRTFEAQRRSWPNYGTTPPDPLGCSCLLSCSAAASQRSSIVYGTTILKYKRQTLWYHKAKT